MPQVIFHTQIFVFSFTWIHQSWSSKCLSFLETYQCVEFVMRADRCQEQIIHFSEMTFELRYVACFSNLFHFLTSWHKGKHKQWRIFPSVLDVVMWVKRMSLKEPKSGSTKSQDSSWSRHTSSPPTSLSLCGSTSIMLTLATKQTGVHFHKCHIRRGCVGSVGASRIGWLRGQRSRQLWRIPNWDTVSGCCFGSRQNANITVAGNSNGERGRMIIA